MSPGTTAIRPSTWPSRAACGHTTGADVAAIVAYVRWLQREAGIE
jgi:hypothetical protein